MRKIIIGFLASGLIGFGLGDWPSRAAEKGPPISPTAAPAGGAPVEAAGAESPEAPAPAGGPMLGPATPPLELVASTPKGELKNPYNVDIAAIAEEGHARQGRSC